MRNGPHLSIIALKSGEISLTIAEYAVSCVPDSSTVWLRKEARVEIFIFEVGGGGEERQNDFLNYSFGSVGMYT